MTPNISQPSSGKIIQNSNGHALLNQLINKMAAYETSAARNKNPTVTHSFPASDSSLFRSSNGLGGGV